MMSVRTSALVCLCVYVCQTLSPKGNMHVEQTCHWDCVHHPLVPAKSQAPELARLKKTKPPSWPIN